MWEKRGPLPTHQAAHRQWHSGQLAVDSEPQGQVCLAPVASSLGAGVCVTSAPSCAGRETISVEGPWLTPDG